MQQPNHQPTQELPPDPTTIIGTAAVPRVIEVEPGLQPEDPTFTARDSFTRSLDPARQSVISRVDTVPLRGTEGLRSVQDEQQLSSLPVKPQRPSLGQRRSGGIILSPTSKTVQAVRKSREQ